MELQTTTFYGQIKGTTKLDLRDARGRVHEASLVLVQYVLALLSNRDGNMSRIHEHMELHYVELVIFLEIKDAPPIGISRSQLPVFLSKINYELLAFFIIKNAAFEFRISSQSWYALDGKELRGTIEKGSKRGEAIVLAVSHEDREVVGQCYYNGKKESEIPAVRTLLKERKLTTQKITMDALHLNPTTLELISGQEGQFLVGLKGNQEVLCEQMENVSSQLTIEHERLDESKKNKHGRKEERHYISYDVSELEFDERWHKVKFKTLVQVTRKQKVVKSGKEMHEISYYLSNTPCKDIQVANELFDAVRNHWQVETHNNTRDTVLKEDKLRCKNTNTSRTTSCCRTLVIRVLNKLKPKNKRKKIDYFSDHFSDCLRCLRGISFL